jgi:hypothetical protein
MHVLVFDISVLIFSLSFGETCNPGEFFDCSGRACTTTASEKICFGGSFIADVIEDSHTHCHASRACRITSPGQYSCDCPETQTIDGVCGCSANNGPSCTKCPAGKYSDATTLMYGGCGCVTCSAGKSSEPGSVSCTPLCDTTTISVNGSVAQYKTQNRTCISGGQNKKAPTMIAQCAHFLVIMTIVSLLLH